MANRMDVYKVFKNSVLGLLMVACMVVLVSAGAVNNETCVGVHSLGNEFYSTCVCGLLETDNFTCECYEGGEYMCFNKSKDVTIKIVPQDFNVTGMGNNWVVSVFTNTGLWIVFISLSVICLLIMGVVWILRNTLKQLY